MQYLRAFLLFLVSTSVLANAIGTDFQNFNPTSNGVDFVTVQSAETLEPGILNLGLFFNYAVNPLPEFSDQEKERGSLRNSLTSLDLNIGLGILPNLEIGANIPATLSQSIREDNERVQFADKGVNEVRFSTKYRLWSNEFMGIAAIGSFNRNTITNNPYRGRDPGPIYNLEMAWDVALGKNALGVNLGYRSRHNGERFDNVPVVPLKDQYLYSMAASRLVDLIDSVIILEVFGTQPVSQNSEQTALRNMTSAEGLLGLKHLISHNLALHFGGGTYLDKTAASPDFRIYTGINWATGPVFEKKQVVRKRKVVRKPKLEISEEPDEVYTVNNIEFAFDRHDVVVAGSLDSTVAFVKELIAKGVRKLVVEGYTDSLGSRKYNQQLSERRANFVREYIVKSSNIDPEIISAEGKGEEDPVADNSNYQGRQRNRRVEFAVFYKKSPQ